MERDLQSLLDMLQSAQGDFQTPDSLARAVTRVLKEKHHLSPDVVIEPSCGRGAFIRAALDEFEPTQVIGLEINPAYIQAAICSLSAYSNVKSVTLHQADFFKTDWNTLLSKLSGYLLVLGNPPWVTNSKLGVLNSRNLPAKSNFQNRRGIEAITGSGNFDISEAMLLQQVAWLSGRVGTIAVLCKYAVARRVIRQVNCQGAQRFSACIYLIDAKAEFGASVEACLLVLSTDAGGRLDCKVYQTLNSQAAFYAIGERDGFLLRDTAQYERWRHLLGPDSAYGWRSGIKHDCSKVMELEQIRDDLFLNGMDEVYDLEQEYLYPLLKSADIGNGRTNYYRKLVLVTQRLVNDDTCIIQDKAPKTWQYLLEHDSHLKARKSAIYKNRPPYSIFGIGAYSFKPWKIAISGLYKQLNFGLVGPLDGKPVMVDDTVNFLAFEILKRLSLKAVAKELEVLESDF
jgi:hypothetical protein